jgi:hypothetical protein
MDNNLLQLKVQERLNKLSSSDYENIECWQIVEAFNKVQLDWNRRNLRGNNSRKAGDEHYSFSIDDFQVPLQGTNKPDYFVTTQWPADFMKFKRVSTQAQTKCCPARSMTVYEAEEQNADILLGDDNTEPNFEWGETFCTRIGNTIRIYTAGKFDIVNPTLTYYRLPKPISIAGCVDQNGNTTVDSPCEFKDDITEVLIAGTVALLAGDYDDWQQAQRGMEDEQVNE